MAAGSHRSRAAGIGLGGQPTDNFTIPGTESQRAVELLQLKLPPFSGAQTQLTFVTAGGAKITDAPVAAAIQKSIANLKTVPQVAVAGRARRDSAGLP